jgi:hypothetical protein
MPKAKNAAKPIVLIPSIQGFSVSCGGFSSADFSRRVIKKFGKWVPSASKDALVGNGLAVSTAVNLYYYTGIAGFGVMNVMYEPWDNYHLKPRNPLTHNVCSFEPN